MTKLSKSISVAELMHMREEEHLSNQDIAKRLGISTKTVYAYIGNQPKGMRKPWGSNRKKAELPALTEKTEVPEMPHESFKERCEKMAQRHGTLAERAAGMIEDEGTKQTLMTEMKKAGFQPFSPLPDVGESPVEAVQKIPVARIERTSHLPELVAVFGADAVRQYLRVALYDKGIPDCRTMTRADMLSALESLNKILNPEVNTHD